MDQKQSDDWPCLCPLSSVIPRLVASVCVCCIQIDLSSNFIGAEGAKALANALRAKGSLTRLNVKFNVMGEEGKAALREVIEGRSGFELLL